MAEFRRILKPDGWVAIIAFGRTEEGHEEKTKRLSDCCESTPKTTPTPMPDTRSLPQS